MSVRTFCALGTILAATSCIDTTGVNLNDVPGYMISEVRITPSVDTIFVTDTIRASDRITFSAIATGKNGAILPSLTFAWSTSNPSIATVDASGTVTPRALGVVEIIASADKVARATLVILPATVSLSVTPVEDTIFVATPIVPTRDTLRLTASARDLAGAPLGGVIFSWASSAPSVAIVDGTGLVSAIGLGSATITASATGGNASSRIHVVAAPGPS